MPAREFPSASRGAEIRRLFWAAAWLAIVLVSVKAYYLGAPDAHAVLAGEQLRSIAAISYVDVLFAAAFWLCARAALTLLTRHRRMAQLTSYAFVSCSALCCVYAVANVVIFGVLGGFLTYPLLSLVGDVRMLRSSVALHLTTPVVLGLVCVPLVYIALVQLTVTHLPPASRSWWQRRGIALASLGMWAIFGQHAFAADWATRQHRQIAENAHWVLVSSWWQAVSGETTVRMADPFSPADLADFEPRGSPPLSPAPVIVRPASSSSRRAREAMPVRPPNVVFIVLESVAARWAGLNGGPYDTTPYLRAESSQGLVFDHFYAHIGRSSDSLAAMLLSAYPKLGFRDLTEEYPRLAGTSLAALFGSRGYRTAFMTPSDLSWAEWATFLVGRGFDDVRDYRQLPCSAPLSSWGVEDRCMVDGVIQFIEQDPTRPFFVMAWSQQTHHPYEPTPGVPLLDLLREPVPDDYNLGRYLNVLRETDRHLGRLFETIRRAGLEKDTLIVITGDHGQAFGYPHDSYGQGRGVYEEDVNVPLMLWYPRLYQSSRRSKTLGGHVDLAPTIADLTGLQAPPDWQGRSLFDSARAPRAYFYVAEDRFSLGVREGNWKYIFDLREGTEELFDLDRDPTEQQNLASKEPERCARLRQRLAAWTEANRRQYEPAPGPAT